MRSLHPLRTVSVALMLVLGRGLQRTGLSGTSHGATSRCNRAGRRMPPVRYDHQ